MENIRQILRKFLRVKSLPLECTLILRDITYTKTTTNKTNLYQLSINTHKNITEHTVPASFWIYKKNLKKITKKYLEKN